MSGYRNQRPGSSNRPSSSGSYDSYNRYNNRYTEGQQPHPPPAQQTSASGSTYKPSFSSRYPGGSSSTGTGPYRRDDGYRERDRDRYPPRRDYEQGGYRRDSYYSSRGGQGSRSFSGGYRDRAERDRAERPAPSNAAYPPATYEDRRHRDQGSTSWYPNHQRAGLRSDATRRSDVDLLDYDFNDTNKDQHSSRQPLPPQSQLVPPSRSRPSLIPKDFKDEDNDEDEDEAALEKAVRETIERQKPSVKTSSDPITEPTKAERVEESIAERLPLPQEHKEEIENDTSDDFKEVSVESTTVKKPSSPVQQHVTTVEKLDLSSEVQEQVLQVHDKSDQRDIELSDGYDPDEDLQMTTSTTKSLVEEAKPHPIVDEEVKDQTSDIVTQETQNISSVPPSSFGKSQDETEIESAPPKPLTSTIPQPLKSTELKPLTSPEGCIFPLPRLQQRIWDLKNHPRPEIHRRLPYLLKKPVKDFADYPFYNRNFLVHKQGTRPKLLNSLSIIKATAFSHTLDLLNEYSNREQDWNNRCRDMEDQLSEVYPHSKKSSEVEEKEEPEAQSTQDSRNSRRSRHGDTVRSEAEFMEILKNLEKEKENDPLYRAERLAAEAPRMLNNPLEAAKSILNLNNLVTDKAAWAHRIHTDGIDNFTKKEHELFCEAYLAHPKKFGRIASIMNTGRTAQECVLHYYKTKKTVTDYKKLISLKKKKGKSKGRGRRKAKSTTGTPATETPNESGDELNLQNFVPEGPDEELLTETGRRRRAAAPVFESEKGEELPEERKRSLGSSDGTEDDEKKGKKKQRGGRPKKTVDPSQLPPEVLEAPTETDKGKNAISSYWSVRDIGIFYHWLTKLGKDWDGIAQRLGTKTATMVRNYYQRNADSHGWKDLVQKVERRKQHEDQPLGAPTMPSSNAVSDLQRQQQQSQQNHVPRVPALGFFTAPSDVPSNVTYVQPVSTLPKLQRMSPTAPNALPLMHASPYPPVQDGSFIKKENGQPIFPPMQQVQPTNGVSSSALQPPFGRSNPFSITNLLNPPAAEERKVPSFPVPGRFSPVPEKREIYSNNSGTLPPLPPHGKGAPQSMANILNQPSGPAHVASQPHQFQSTQPAGLNPIDALIAAADQKQWKPQTPIPFGTASQPSTQQQPSTPASAGPSFPGRSILNPADQSPRRPSVPSVHNLLNNDGPQ